MNFKLFFYIFLLLIICSCVDYFDDVKKINFKELIPAGKTQIFPYSEFPDGLDIEFFDKKEGSTKVSANYGIVYYLTKIVSLEGNVIIQSPDSSFVKSNQIFWDPEQEWLFTEEKIVFSSDDYNIRAEKMDADRSFKLLKTGKLDGSFLFEDEE